MDIQELFEKHSYKITQTYASKHPNIMTFERFKEALDEYHKSFPVELPVKPANGVGREDKIMELLQDFWNEHNNNKAVVWIRNDNTGQLAVYTRGEYAKDLIQFISRLSV